MKLYSKHLDNDGNVVLTCKRLKVSDMIVSLVGLLIGALMVFPIFYTLAGGLRDDDGFNQYPPALLPKVQNIVLRNYTDELLHHQISYDQYKNSRHIQSLAEDFGIPRIPRFLFNSVVTAGLGTLIRMLLATLAAYSFAFYKLSGNKALFYAVFISVVMPSELFIIANFMTVERLLLIDSYLGIMIVNFISAISIFALRQKFKTVAHDQREAALLDGCGSLNFLVKLCLPTSKPIFFILCSVSFVELWNAYLWPLLVTNKEWMRTISVGVTLLYFPQSQSLAPLFAALGLSILPLLLLVCIF